MNGMGMGNPLAALSGLSGLAGLSGVLSDVAKSPITRWNQSGIVHKLVAAGAGAGVAYWLHAKGMADGPVAVAGLVAAYATSMALNYPAVARQTMAGPAVATGTSGMQGLPPAQVASMNHVANQMFSRGLPVAAPPAAPQGRPMAPVPMQGMGAAGGKWDLLSVEM